MLSEVIVCGAMLSGAVAFFSFMNAGLYGAAFNVPILLSGVWLLQMVLAELRTKRKHPSEDKS